jgi:hypothetical protein
MERNESSPLYKNTYIKEPELRGRETYDSSESLEYREYYKARLEKEKRRRTMDQVDLHASGVLFADTDDVFLENTNPVGRDNGSIHSLRSRDSDTNIKGSSGMGGRFTKKQTTIVSIDSRSRDKAKYKSANSFEIELPRTFNNIKSMKLAQTEFPNTDAVINTTNRKIYWRNKEDIDLDKIDTVTGTYPIYSVDIRIGSYTAITLENEFQAILPMIKRQNLIGDFHYFQTTLNIDTDIVTFTSLILTQLDNNPFSSTTNTGIISVSSSSHGYTNGELIHIIGAKQFAGIPSDSINTDHKITVINSNTFTIEVNEKAIDTLTGGGNVVKTGRLAPFQFLWGQLDNTVAQNIGFALENSSQRIDTSIVLIEPLYQVIIKTTSAHGLSSINIGDLINISGSGTTPTLDGIKQITNIVNTTEFYIQSSTPLTVQTENNGATYIHNTILYNITSLFNYTVSTIIITTDTPHNYTLDDIGELKILLSETNTKPILDGSYTIVNVPSTTTLTINGELLDGGIGTQGFTPTRNPLTTLTIQITDAEVIGDILRLRVNNHGLKVGEKIKVNNINVIPDINLTSRIYTIVAISDINHIDIEYSVSSISMASITNGEAYIGTGLMTVYMPNHGFNKILSIVNSVTVGLIEITTELDHGFITGDKTRIMETNALPNVNGYYTVTVVDNDTFSIPFTPALTIAGTSGIIGMSNNFILYSATTLGGIDQSIINGVSNVVRDTIDLDTFTYYGNELYATSIEKGGGAVFISSLKHGFKGEQDNKKNDLLNRSINLQGQDYVFLCNNELANIENINDNAKSVFARIQLSEAPGAVIFNDFLAVPKLFLDVPLASLSKLKFEVKYYNGNLYDFVDLDWSLAIEIIEILDMNEHSAMSSRRGIIDYTS